jgi:hypothetical protein
LRSLYCCSDGVRGRGAAVKYLSHNASLHSKEKIAPSNRGIKQLGSEARLDYEYERAVVASLLMLFAPLEGWCHVAVRERRTTIMRTSSRTSPTTIFLTLIRLRCYRTISTATLWRRYLRYFRSPRPAVLLNDLSGHIL